MKCNTCRQEVQANCNYNQGRCPHRKPMLDIQSRDISRGHFYVRIVKSAVRIAAGASLVMGAFVVTGTLIILAEILGIVEELVQC